MIADLTGLAIMANRSGSVIQNDEQPKIDYDFIFSDY